jgi:transposase-like protein
VARYGQKFKDQAVAHLLPPESAPVTDLARRFGVSTATLERWRAEAVVGASDTTRAWPPAARLEAVIVTASMDEASRSAWCRENGLYPTDLDTWKQDALSGLGNPADPEGGPTAKRDRRRIKELERDLHRKDKALAETAALLVLSKKLSAIFHEGGDA